MVGKVAELEVEVQMAKEMQEMDKLAQRTETLALA
jgi:hypothetical protein